MLYNIATITSGTPKEIYIYIQYITMLRKT